MPHREAMRIVVAYHYLEREAPCSFAFGLYSKKTDKPCGVVTYGTPSSSTLRAGICGEDEKDNVIELTRLWIADDVPKNGESYLVGNTLGLVDKEIVVSYAEIDQDHVGVIYQATNWIYTGLSAKRTSWTIEGVDKHCHTISDQYTSAGLRRIYGDKFSLVDRPRKHRYVYFNCGKWRRRTLMKKLKYPIKSYPKLNKVVERKRVNSSEVPKCMIQPHIIITSDIDDWI